MFKAHFLFFILIAASPASSQSLPPILDATNYERYLVPVAFGRATIEGAEGSRWQNKIWVRNDGLQRVVVSQLNPTCIVGCNGELTLAYVDPKTSLDFDEPLRESPSNYGIFLHVEKSHKKDIWISSHVHDVSRPDLNLGTEIPIVAEAETFSSRAVFQNVPIATEYRVLLRVYNFSGKSGDEILVKMFPVASNELLFQALVQLRGLGYAEDPQFTPYPGYGEIMIGREIQPEIGSVDRLRVELESLTSGLKYWAMISVTSNQTHQITLITPQPIR